MKRRCKPGSPRSASHVRIEARSLTSMPALAKRWSRNRAWPSRWSLSRRRRSLAGRIEKRQRHQFRRHCMPHRLHRHFHLQQRVPAAACSRAQLEASAIIFFKVGDQVVEVAFPTCRPPRYIGTAKRDAMLGTCGAIPIFSYSASTSFQSISVPTSCRAGPPFLISIDSASRPTKLSFFKSTNFAKPISPGEYFCEAISAFLLEI